MRNKCIDIQIKTPQLILFLLLIFLLGIRQQAAAQCGIALKDVVLKEIGKATYMKDFRVRLEEGRTANKPPTEEFTILLNKGTHYRFNIKADSTCEDQVILKLYDFNTFYGSNFDKSDGTSYEFFDFFCAKTQVYYLAISFANARPGCAAAVVSYVENYNAN